MLSHLSSVMLGAMAFRSSPLMWVLWSPSTAFIIPAHRAFHTERAAHKEIRSLTPQPHSKSMMFQRVIDRDSGGFANPLFMTHPPTMKQRSASRSYRISIQDVLELDPNFTLIPPFTGFRISTSTRIWIHVSLHLPSSFILVVLVNN